jgi:hypothetical protein
MNDLNDSDREFWNMIDNEYGMYDTLDPSISPFNNYIFNVIQPVPGVIILINEDLNGKETW